LSFSEPGWLNDLGSWITYQLTNTEWVRKLQKRVHSTRSASDKVYQLLAHGRWFSPGTPASFTTKTGRHDIAEILLKVVVKHQRSKSNQIIFIYTHKSQLAQRILQFNTLQFGIVLEKF
jgi:hypothetical protein